MKFSLPLALGLLLAVAGCGYQHSPSPYGLLEPLDISVPVAANQSPYGELGPRLTRAVITHLDASANITVREEAPARLRLAIIGVSISGGAWNPNRNEYDLPSASASRVVSLSVEAVLERPAPEGGRPRTLHRRFAGSRNFYVTDDENQARMMEEEAFDWVVADLAQKIAQNMFSEF
jgi:hypothetical protein